MNTRNRSLANKVIQEAGQCELCGSRRNLEAHHIIPIAFGGDDSDENLICVCKKCHSLLTPHKLLTKHGVFQAKYGKLSLKEQIRIELYKKIHEGLEEYGGSNVTTVFNIVCDAIDSVCKSEKIRTEYENL